MNIRRVGRVRFVNHIVGVIGAVGVVGASALPLQACGTGDVQRDAIEAASAEPDAASQAEVARVAQALGEPSCLSAVADEVRPDNHAGLIRSGDASYDHPECRDAFIVDIPNVASGETFYMNADPPLASDVLTNLFGCPFNAGWFYVYEKIDDDYVLVFAEAKFAALVGSLPIVRCNARARFTPTAGSEYRVIIAGRSLFGPKYEVSMLVQ